MGLDMYLYKKTYVKNWDHDDEKDHYEITIKKGGKIYDEIKTNRITEIVEEVAYWRKANHIHNWFVNNVQGGKDDCGEYYVTKDDITKLINICEEVLGSLEDSYDEETNTYKDTSVAERLLPRGDGFFFGSIMYDKWYADDLRDTIEQLQPLLEEKTENFYYQSSW